MGVQGLWTLLEPVGRRIDIQAISNKRLAVDASIWLFQFMRAMRDERGEMIKNAHLLGFFRRICRLLFHKVQPIFVFEGTAPTLKRATTAARRARREVHNVALKRAAEKLLSVQLDILERMRDAQQAANREKFLTAAAGAPTNFSKVQMETYLTASKFRQTIEKHKKAIGGGLQGPQAQGEELQVRLALLRRLLVAGQGGLLDCKPWTTV
eukprot:gene11344-11493_t